MLLPECLITKSTDKKNKTMSNEINYYWQNLYKRFSYCSAWAQNKWQVFSRLILVFYKSFKSSALKISKMIIKKKDITVGMLVSGFFLRQVVLLNVLLILSSKLFWILSNPNKMLSKGGITLVNIHSYYLLIVWL